MSEGMMQRMFDLLGSIEKNTPMVEKRIEDAGLHADKLLVSSVAKYWDTLEKLAAE